MFGLMEVFPHDILLGTDYLCRTPFLIDLKHGLLVNLTPKNVFSTDLLFVQAILSQPQADLNVSLQGPAAACDWRLRDSTVISCGSNTDQRSGFNRMMDSVRSDQGDGNSIMVATDTVFIGSRDSIGQVSNAYATLSATPKQSELTKEVALEIGGTTFISPRMGPEKVTDFEDNELMWAPSNKNFEKLERPDRSHPIDFEELNLSKNLTESERIRLVSLLEEFPEVFPTHGVALGCTNVIKHHIKTGTNSPVNESLRRFAFWQREEINKQIEDMLAEGIITPCQNAEWVAHLVLARKKDGTLRFCVDYKNINERTENDPYPLPRIDDCLDVLRNCNYYTALDSASGY